MKTKELSKDIKIEVSKDNHMDDLLKVALTQINFKEVRGNEHNPEVVKYFQESGFNINDDETAWCSAFINWCAKQSGYESSDKLNARSWLKVGTKSDNMELGDIVILWRESRKSWKGHCGIYIRHDDKFIYLLGGNQSNKVGISAYPIYRVLEARKLNKIK